MAALADDLGGLIGALHVLNSVLWLRANDFNAIAQNMGQP